MDHKNLLKKYIQHVMDCEGSDFISSARTDAGMNDVVFTNDELSELKNLRDSITYDTDLITCDRDNRGEISYYCVDGRGNKQNIPPPIDFIKHSGKNIDLSVENKKGH